MSIRQYKPSDFNALARIYNASRPDEFYAEHRSFTLKAWVEDEYMMSILADSTLYVYEQEEVLGFCGFTGQRINWLFVEPNSRGKKIGEQLLLHLLTKLNQGATLSVWHSNQRAKSLYLKHGFEISRSFYIDFQGERMRVDKMLHV